MNSQYDHRSWTAPPAANTATPPDAPADATAFVPRSTPTPGRRIRIVHISDTHDKAYSLPAGDILVHTGDMTDTASPEELRRFREFLRCQPHKHKILVCGAHEVGLDRMKPSDAAAHLAGSVPDCHLLHDAAVIVEGLKFYGSPWNTSMKAFAMSPEACAIKFQLIPADTDVLVTHQPPAGVLDVAYPPGQYLAPDDSQPPCADCGGTAHPGGLHLGSPALLRKVQQLRIPLHLFGRSHHAAGLQHIGGTLFSNASMEVRGRPVVIDVLVQGAEAQQPPQQHQQQQQQPHAGYMARGANAVPAAGRSPTWAGPAFSPVLHQPVLAHGQSTSHPQHQPQPHVSPVFIASPPAGSLPSPSWFAAAPMPMPMQAWVGQPAPAVVDTGVVSNASAPMPSMDMMSAYGMAPMPMAFYAQPLPVTPQLTPSYASSPATMKPQGTYGADAAFPAYYGQGYSQMPQPAIHGGWHAAMHQPAPQLAMSCFVAPGYAMA
jgi:hypothetical protein